MATPATTAAEYCSLLVKSRLLPAEEVDSLYKRWKEERPGSDARVDSFRRFLVTRRTLTEYQAALIQRGRSDGFFLGGYKILDQIGKGQMGGVYKAVHNFGQLVALKILPASRAKNSHVLGRFQREARLLTQLDHPNVVRAYQVGESGGVHYIVMEFLEGETLDEVLDRRGRLPISETIRLMRQTLDGLQHLHERRTVHRDLKPSNLMITPGGEGKADTTWESTIKILDIGLGRELFDDDAPEAQIETQLTQEGSVLGTPDYLAPEQAKDARSADIRADVYSAGCVLYHCLAGRPPFPETNIMAQMLKHATEKPAPLSTLVEGNVPPAFQAVVDKMLAKKPEERYQTPAEAAEALKPFAASGPPAAASKVLPAYKDWLDSESQMEMPKPLAPPAAKPGSKPAPALPATSKPAPAVPGLTATTFNVPAIRTAPPVSKPVAPPKPVAPVVAPAALPAPAAPPAEEEMDVELVMEPAPAAPAFDPYAVPVAAAPLPREQPLWPPSRRDWIMLTAGAFGVVSAVGMGFVLARAARGGKRDADDDKKAE
jgi:serine/threonine protein kinase